MTTAESKSPAPVECGCAGCSGGDGRPLFFIQNRGSHGSNFVTAHLSGQRGMAEFMFDCPTARAIREGAATRREANLELLRRTRCVPDNKC